jgi:hypothetical protein
MNLIYKIMTEKSKTPDSDELNKAVYILKQKIKEIMPHFLELQQIKDRNEEEEKAYQDIKDLLAQTYVTIDKITEALSNKLYARSFEVYYYFKELAGKGDEKAKEVYEKMKPLEEDTLNKMLKDELN